ncbi:methionyl-tRNA formyltransferase [Brumicola pallidula]|uniref:UDP-4-amino-4-deoxy-L-arabinose formyltransferase n=1 Tax=Brumicola pallidula DSM 14239 = ACAM 615 TaxID=1121922 RepID=K7A312_9ALTE|nr:formyltransferase family protein [Glaciecola pallidula]GAC29860.1 UDP-4-amino-4-deoxy-L-arabinose formyltransferase [Glaciecola pallidula DSM 14239 = ACAM 615]
MRIILLAAAERGIRCFEKIASLINSEDELTVFTFPETSWEPPFSERLETKAKELGANFFKSSKVHNDEYKFLWDSCPDLILVIGWRYLIPESVYNSATIGCFVFHDSLLPKYRGFGPSVWALKNGEQQTGATLFKIASEMDAGPVLAQQKIAIEADDYIYDVVNKVTSSYLDILESIFPKFQNNTFNLEEQDHSQATYTCKSMPADFKINWHEPAEKIRNLIRAYSPPYSGSYCDLQGEKLIILSADIDYSKKYVGIVPGRIIKIEEGAGVYVGTGDYPLIIKNVLTSNSSIQNATNIINKISLTLR